MKPISQLLLGLVLLLSSTVQGYDRLPPFIGIHRGSEIAFELHGPTVLSDALAPIVRKMVLPQSMFHLCGWRDWETTNYAAELYRPYNRFFLSGDSFYDFFGNYITQGWMLYNSRLTRPHLFGSSDFFGISRLGTGDFLIASDSMEGSSYAITIGHSIYTVLTPMTFAKPNFSGVKWDFLHKDDVAATLLLSKISGYAQNTTNLTAGRIVTSVPWGIKIGATYVNAHHVRTTEELSLPDLITGQLTAHQLDGTVDKLFVRLGDHSPADGEKGAWLFNNDILITDVHGNRIRGKDIHFYPTVEGGVGLGDLLMADGNEEILLTYDLSDPSYAGPPPSRIKRLTLQLDIAHDYRVDVTSNRQTDQTGQSLFFPIAWAKGNVKDESNRTILTYDYGLPTATEICGFTVELPDHHGFGFLGEFDVSRTYRRYPNVDVHNPFTSSSASIGWYLNAFYTEPPYLSALEIFSIDKGYNTTTFAADGGGMIDYDQELIYWYEFVDDNDDQDRIPDWPRQYAQPDKAIFPGWDENNDFISDFNQNDNLTRPNYAPDYEEPFLRYSVDHPEFLFGMDMNHNGWVDRFENDTAPDYPYKKDHRGYNFYVRYAPAPDVHLTVGRLHEALIFDEGQNSDTYLLCTVDHDHPRFGRLRLFEHLRKVRDNIPDDLLQWEQPPGSLGYLCPIEDPLRARNTWIHTIFLEGDHAPIQGLHIVGKLKHELYYQRAPNSVWTSSVLTKRNPRRSSYFFGLIAKADYTYKLRSWRIQPKWKSTYRRERPYLRAHPIHEALEETLFLMVKCPLLHNTTAEMGIEWTRFLQLRGSETSPYSGDFRGRVWALQLTNLVDYYGYRITAQVGYRWDRKWFEKGAKSTSTLFISVFAGTSAPKLWPTSRERRY